MTITLQDDFTGSAGPISGHTPTGAGGAWVSHPVSPSVIQLDGAGYLKTAAATVGYAYNAVDPGADDYAMTISLGLPEGINGPRVRHDTTANTCYEAVFYVSAEQIILRRQNAGTQTVLQTWSGQASCSSLKLEVSGTGSTVTLKVYKDGSATALTPAGYADSSASRIVTRGKQGVLIYDVSSPNSGITAVTGENAGAPVATQITMSGPAGGDVGVESTDFSFTADAPVASDITITPASDKAGTWSPAAPVIATGATSVTSRFTPSVSGTHAISFSNDGGLAEVGEPASYAASSGPVTITTSALHNNTETGHASAAVVWSWFPSGRIGALAAVSAEDGTGTTDASGQLSVAGRVLPGVLMVAVQNTGADDDDVYYEAFS